MWGAGRQAAPHRHCAALKTPRVHGKAARQKGHGSGSVPDSPPKSCGPGNSPRGPACRQGTQTPAAAAATGGPKEARLGLGARLWGEVSEPGQPWRGRRAAGSAGHRYASKRAGEQGGGQGSADGAGGLGSRHRSPRPTEAEAAGGAQRPPVPLRGGAGTRLRKQRAWGYRKVRFQGSCLQSRPLPARW